MVLANGKAWDVLVRILATQAAIPSSLSPSCSVRAIAILLCLGNSCGSSPARPSSSGTSVGSRCRFQLFHSSIERTISLLTTRYNQLQSTHKTLAMKTKTINLKEIPTSLDLEISKSLVDYSVALGRVQGDGANTFSPLGSGTLVTRDGKFGILTAYHCLHNKENRDVHLGGHNGDKLLLILTRGRSVIVESHEAQERFLAIPVSAEFGPDLTFIEIHTGPRLDSIRAISSFWNLSLERRDQAHQFAHPGICIANVGYPSVDYHTNVSDNEIHHAVKHMAFIGALAEGETFSRDGWDYIESSTNRGVSAALPKTFRGVSGGGIWAVCLHVSQADVWSVHATFLVGVTFYQTAEVDLRRNLRGHYIDSIYETAWKQNG